MLSSSVEFVGTSITPKPWELKLSKKLLQGNIYPSSYYFLGSLILSHTKPLFEPSPPVLVYNDIVDTKPEEYEHDTVDSEEYEHDIDDTKPEEYEHDIDDTKPEEYEHDVVDGECCSDTTEDLEETGYENTRPWKSQK